MFPAFDEVGRGEATKVAGLATQHYRDVAHHLFPGVYIFPQAPTENSLSIRKREFLRGIFLNSCRINFKSSGNKGGIGI